MKMKYLYLLLILTLISCHKDPIPFQSKSISDLTSDVPEEIKEKTQLRLAFAKAVANALEDVEFRDYINRVSRKNSGKYFNEILFAIHKDEKAVGNKTLETVVEEAADKEIKDLYGSEFIGKVLVEDPLVAIKIPDIFYDFNWETQKYAPMVLAKTPVDLQDENNFKAFYAYHFSGYQAVFSQHKIPKYFSLVIKYSEDYILYNKLTKQNEKNIQIGNIINQVEKVWTDLEAHIIQSGVSYSMDNKFVFIKKRDIFDAYKTTYEPSSFQFGDFSNCNEICKRDCLPKDSINNVLEKIKLMTPIIIDSDQKGSILFEENYSLLYFISIPNNAGIPVKIVDEYSLAGFRKVEFVNRNLDIKYKLEKNDYEDIGEVNLMTINNIDYNSNKFKGMEIVLNHLIEKGWQGDSRYNLSIMELKQEDLVNVFTSIDRIIFPKPVIATSIFLYGNSPLSYCAEPTTNYSGGGILNFVVKY